MDKVLGNKQLQARNMFVEVDDDIAGKTIVAGNAIKMSNIPEEATREPAPKIGEHTTEILGRYMDYDEQKLKQMKEDGVI